MTGMPAWGKSMDDESIWGMVAFLQRLPGMPADQYHELVEASEGHTHGAADAAVDEHADDACPRRWLGARTQGLKEEYDMIRFIALTLAALSLLPGLALAHTPQIDVPEAAQAAAATVDRFFDALSAGDLERAGAELDPQVIILESGGAEHSAAEYLGGHARDDAEFLKAAQQNLGRRIGQGQR